MLPPLRQPIQARSKLCRNLYAHSTHSPEGCVEKLAELIFKTNAEIGQIRARHGKQQKTRVRNLRTLAFRNIA